MEQALVEQRIQNFIYEQFPLSRTLQVTATDNLFSAGVVDSLGILDLVTFLENEFHIEVSDEELTPEHFETIDGIVRFLEKKKNGE